MLAQTAREAARRFGERLVVDAPDGRLTYAELDESSRALASGLADRVGVGDLVALVLPSGPEWLVAAVALDHLGAAVAGVSPVLSAPERAAQVELLAPRLVLATPDTTDGLPLRTPVSVVAPGGRCTELASAGPPPEPATHDPDRLAMVCCTSGTTGRAKAARFLGRHLRAVRDIDLGEARDRWDGGSHMLASTQFAHVGMSLKLPWYLQTGSTLHVMGRWRADDALELVSRHRMATIGVVAPQLALMLRSPRMDDLDLSCVQAIIAGGAASPPALVAEARERFGAAYSIRYSSTESGGVGLGTAFDASDDEALHTIGRPRPGVEARVADEDDRPLPVGEVGELQLRSPAVMDGYHRDAEATAAALTPDGWLRSGDLARTRPDGTFVLAGRRTDMYIRGGYNVHPEEVEAVLGEHPGVDGVAVVGQPDPVMGEVGVAVVVPADPHDGPSLESLRTFAAERLARHKLPERLVVVDRLPLTDAQKLDRRAVRAQALGEG